MPMMMMMMMMMVLCARGYVVSRPRVFFCQLHAHERRGVFFLFPRVCAELGHDGTWVRDRGAGVSERGNRQTGRHRNGRQAGTGMADRQAQEWQTGRHRNGRQAGTGMADRQAGRQAGRQTGHALPLHVLYYEWKCIRKCIIESLNLAERRIKFGGQLQVNALLT
jgi:hypothetical protein